MAYGCTITVDTGKAPSQQSNFTWLFTEDNLPTAAIDGGATSILNGGGNLRCYTDSTKATQLPIEVVKFVTGLTPNVQVHGLSPLLGVGDTVYIEADSVATTQPPVTDTYGRNAVWVDMEYRSNDGGVTESSNGYAIADDGSGSVVTGRQPSFNALDAPRKRLIDTSVGDTVGDYRLSSWHNGTTAGTLLCRRDSGSMQYQIGILSNTYFYQDSSGTVHQFSSSTTGWHKVDFVIIGTNCELFVDGVSAGNATITKSSQPTIPLRVGYRGNGGLGTVGFAYNDEVGEVGVDIDRGSDYVLTEYNNQNDSATFWTTSAWEEQTTPTIVLNPDTVTHTTSAIDPVVNLASEIQLTPDTVIYQTRSVDPTVVLSFGLQLNPETTRFITRSIDPQVEVGAPLLICSHTIDYADSLITVKFGDTQVKVEYCPK